MTDPNLIFKYRGAQNGEYLGLNKKVAYTDKKKRKKETKCEGRQNGDIR